MKVTKPPMLKRLKGSQKGLSLIELLLVIALTGIIGAVATMSISQVFTSAAISNDQNTAINQVRNAGHWISRDALMAQSVTPDSGASGFPLTLGWTDNDGNVHQVIYSLETMSGGLKKLQRQETTGSQVTTTVISQYIATDNTNCSWDEVTLTVTVTATVGDKTETRTFEVKPRPDASPPE